MSEFTHFDKHGQAHMVDVSDKSETQRQATAQATLHMRSETLDAINGKAHHKGDVLGVARIAGIQAAKATSTLIPLCHPLPLSKVAIEFRVLSSTELQVAATVKTRGVTGVEMEALTAVTICALTIYDMCKAIDKGIRITDTMLVEKLGGKSGHWKVEEQHG